MRVKGGVVTARRRKRMLNQASGYFGARKKLYKTAKQAVIRAAQYAYRDRKARKREMRSLWIVRINAACRIHGYRYGSFIDALNKQHYGLDRKALAAVAFHEPEEFKRLLTNVMAAAAATPGEAAKG